MSLGRGGIEKVSAILGVAGNGGDLLLERLGFATGAADRTFRRLSLRWCLTPYGRRPAYEPLLRSVGLWEPSLLLIGLLRELERAGTGKGGLGA
jgi:hypothetical protein